MQRAVGAEHAQHLPAARRDDQRYVGVHGLALQDGGHAHHVQIAGVGARADAHLVHMDGAGLCHGFHVVGHVRQRHHRHQRRQINLHRLVIRRIRVGGQRDKVRLAALRLQEAARHLVRGEHGRRRAQLRAHVGNGCTFGDGQCLNARPRVLHHLAHAALDGEAAQQLQNHVLGGHASAEPPREAHAYHAGAAEIIRAAAHGHRHVQPARADGDHAQRAAGGGVAVAAKQRFARLADAFQLHLMADAVARLAQIDAVLAGDACDIAVVVRVFKAGLEGVVIDVGHAAFGFDAFYIHGLKLQIGHGPGGILRERLVDADSDFAARLELAGYQMGGKNLLGYVHAFGPPYTFPVFAARFRQAALCLV